MSIILPVMTSEIRINSFQKFSGQAILGILIIGIVICAIPAVAVEFPTTQGGVPSGYLDFEYWNPYAGWDMDMISTATFDTYFPIMDESWAEELPSSDSSVDHWVTFSYFPAGSEPGQPAILSGYVGRRSYNAEVTITGKKNAADVFHKIITIRPQENGVFVWAIPDDLQIVQFYQAIARVGDIPAKSEIVSTSLGTDEIPVSSDPSSAFATDSIASSTSDTSAPVSTASAPASTSSSLPIITYLTLSANNLRPAVGQEVTLSGSLTGNGKGVPGAIISIEVPDYGTDFLPLVSTTTDSNGRFTATINTWEAGVVPVRAVFAGDDKYQAATSSILTFTAGTS